MTDVRCRRPVNAMTQAEVQHYVDAVTEMKQTGVYDEFIRIHAQAATPGHFGPAFCPWHRKFMLTFEDALRQHDPQVSDPADSTLALPYWDWETPSPSIWADDHLGGTGTPAPFNTGPWASDPPQRGSFDTNGAPGDNGLSLSMTLDRYWTEDPEGTFLDTPESRWGFRERFEFSPHAGAHVWIGGGQSIVTTAAEDPLFFLLHSNVERYYVRWQAERRREWLVANPGGSYGQDQLEADYHWGYDDGTGPVETWDFASHNLDDLMWPWDGTDPFIGNEQVRVRDMLEVRDLPYVYDTEAPWVTLDSPSSSPASLTFAAVPQGDTHSRAATFAVKSCEQSAQLVVDSVTGGFTSPHAGPVTVTPAAGDTVTEQLIWFQYTGGTPGTSATGEATVSCPETGQQWTIGLSATSIERKTVGTVLALDQSGSMTADAGGRTRAAVLQEAAAKFVELLRPDDGVGVVTFETDATVDASLADAGDGSSGTGADAAHTAITGYTPVVPPTWVPEGTDDTVPGYTSIGDGVVAAQGELAPSGPYDERAVVVFTDGHENRPQYLSDLGETVLDGRVFAIGLGSASEVRPAALAALAGDHDGYLLMTGTFDSDDYFLLDKYFLQVLAGVTNAQVVADPEGHLRPPDSGDQRRQIRIPFDLTAADVGADVILLTPAPETLSLAVETPTGDEIRVGTAQGTPGIDYVEGGTMNYYRFSLPAVLPDGAEAHAGRWHAIVELDTKAVAAHRDRLEERADEFEEAGDDDGFERVRRELRTLDALGIRYDVAVQARSDLRLDATVTQEHREPGSELIVRARLTEAGIPLSRRAAVRLRLEDPDGTERTLRLHEVEAGVYEVSLTADTAGVYRLRVLAEGETLGGEHFEREHLLSAAIWAGGNDPLPSGVGTSAGRDSTDQLSELLLCLIREGSLDEYLDENDILPGDVEDCLEKISARER